MNDTHKRLKILDEEKSAIREKSQVVTEVDKRFKMHTLSIRELFKKNFANKRSGYAVAHCQVVGENPLKFFVLSPEIFNSEYREILEDDVIINPVILEKEEKYKTQELCLSFPFENWQNVKRFNKIKVQYQVVKDGNLSEPIIKEIDGLLAQIFQHEVEHFEGKTIYDNRN